MKCRFVKSGTQKRFSFSHSGVQIKAGCCLDNLWEAIKGFPLNLIIDMQGGFFI